MIRRAVLIALLGALMLGAAELAAHFDVYFTPEIKRMIATKTPEKLPNGLYIITWKARGNEYSIHFKPDGSRFVLDGLSEGPG